MKPRPFSLIALCVCLVVAVVWELAAPAVAVAASGSAKCGGGVTVTCIAYRCDCQDNVGCTAYDAQGNVISSASKQCPYVAFYTTE